MPEPSRIALTFWAAVAFLGSVALVSVSVPGLPWPAFLFPVLSLVCVLNPAAGSLAAIFLIPVSGVMRDFVAVPYFAPAELVIYVWVLGWLCRRAAERRLGLHATALDPWIVVWLCVILGSGLAELKLGAVIGERWTEGWLGLPGHAGRYLFEHRIMLRPLFVPLAGVMAYAAVIQTFHGDQEQRKASGVFLAAIGCAALYGLAQFLFEFQLRDGWRVRGGLVAVNLFASLLVLGVGLGLSGIDWNSGRRKWLAPGTIALLAACLLVIRSRAGWMGAAGAVAIYIAIRHRQFPPRIRRTIAVAAALALIGVVLLAVVASQIDVDDRYESVGGGVLYSLNPQQLARTVELRLPFWSAAMHAIADHPVLGIGLGRFWSSSYIWDEIGRYRHAHNVILNLTAELGLIGLAVFLGILTTWFRSCKTLYRSAADQHERTRLTGLLAGVGGFLITGITDDPLAHSEGQIFFWIVLALGMPLASVHVWTRSKKRFAIAAVAACLLTLTFREPRPIDEQERRFLELPQAPASPGHTP